MAKVYRQMVCGYAHFCTFQLAQQKLFLWMTLVHGPPTKYPLVRYCLCHHFLQTSQLEVSQPSYAVLHIYMCRCLVEFFICFTVCTASAFRFACTGLYCHLVTVGRAMCLHVAIFGSYAISLCLLAMAYMVCVCVHVCVWCGCGCGCPCGLFQSAVSIFEYAYSLDSKLLTWNN